MLTKTHPDVVQAPVQTRSMTMIQALRSAMDVMLERDPDVVVFGQDVGYFGGVFRCTEGLQAKYGAAVDWTISDIQAGDLVFTYRGGTDPTVISHVGIAISSTQWIHAAGTGMGVITSSLPADSKILAVRRILS